MRRALPPWLSRLAALLLLIGVIVGGYLLAVVPLVAHYRETETALEHAREMIASYQRIAVSRPALEKRLNELTQQQSLSGLYVSAETEALAAADLQGKVSAIIQRSGGQLRSIQSLPSQADEGLRGIGVRVHFTGTTATLEQVIYDLEADKPLLFVDKLQIQNRMRRRRDREAQDNPNLVIRFDVLGYLRPETG
jgi:general secretion pathway protein M